METNNNEVTQQKKKRKRFFQNDNIPNVEEPTENKTDEFNEEEDNFYEEEVVKDKIQEAVIVNLESFASHSNLSFPAKSRLQYLIDSKQIKKEMTVEEWKAILSKI